MSTVRESKKFFENIKKNKKKVAQKHNGKHMKLSTLDFGSQILENARALSTQRSVKQSNVGLKIIKKPTFESKNSRNSGMKTQQSSTDFSKHICWRGVSGEKTAIVPPLPLKHLRVSSKPMTFRNINPMNTSREERFSMISEEATLQGIGNDTNAIPEEQISFLSECEPKQMMEVKHVKNQSQYR